MQFSNVSENFYIDILAEEHKPVDQDEQEFDNRDGSIK